MATQQDVGQWEHENPTPHHGERYKANWWFKRPQDGQWKTWPIYWYPSNPEWCYYYRPPQPGYPGGYVWRCMTHHHVNYPNNGNTWCIMQNGGFGPPGDPPDIPGTNDKPEQPPDPPFDDPGSPLF